MNTETVDPPIATEDAHPVTALALAPRAEAFLAPRSIDEAIRASSLLAKSKMIPIGFQGKPEDVFVAIQYGQEVGLAPMAALQSIAVINGKPGLYGDGFLAVVQSSPSYEWHRETFDETTMTASCEFKRKGSPTTFAGKFSQIDAVAAGLWKKAGPWTQYPKRMLQLRARTFAARDAFADALRGISSAEELQDYVEITPEANGRPAIEMPREKAIVAPTLESEIKQAGPPVETEHKSMAAGLAPEQGESAAKTYAVTDAVEKTSKTNKIFLLVTTDDGEFSSWDTAHWDALKAAKELDQRVFLESETKSSGGRTYRNILAVSLAGEDA